MWESSWDGPWRRNGPLGNRTSPLDRRPHSDSPEKATATGLQPERGAGPRLGRSHRNDHLRRLDSPPFRPVPDPTQSASAHPQHEGPVHPGPYPRFHLVEWVGRMSPPGRCGHNRLHVGLGARCPEINLGGPNRVHHPARRHPMSQTNAVNPGSASLGQAEVPPFCTSTLALLTLGEW